MKKKRLISGLEHIETMTQEQVINEYVNWKNAQQQGTKVMSFVEWQKYFNKYPKYD